MECEMESEAGVEMALCRLVITYLDRASGRPADWPPEAVAPFVESDG